MTGLDAEASEPGRRPGHGQGVLVVVDTPPTTRPHDEAERHELLDVAHRRARWPWPAPRMRHAGARERTPRLVGGLVCAVATSAPRCRPAVAPGLADRWPPHPTPWWGRSPRRHRPLGGAPAGGARPGPGVGSAAASAAAAAPGPRSAAEANRGGPEPGRGGRTPGWPSTAPVRDGRQADRSRWPAVGGRRRRRPGAVPRGRRPRPLGCSWALGPRSGSGLAGRAGRSSARPGRAGRRGLVDPGARCAVVEVVVAVSALLLETTLDHLQGQEVLTLLAQHPAQALDVLLVELPVARRRPFGVDQTLALEEADLGDGDVGELLTQQGQDVADGQVRSGRSGRTRSPVPCTHSSTAAR